MRHQPSFSAALVLIACLAGPPRASSDDTPLGLADLEAYWAALSSKPIDSAPLVRFRDLWDHPEEFVGRPVSVEGKVARLFGQPGIGEFPPLVEAWVVSPSGDPFCLVFPALEGRLAPEIGSMIRFSGTFLKRIKYQGGDNARLAPLIVGPEAPPVAKAGPAAEGMSWSSIDWTVAVVACLVVGLVLARRHLAQPIVPPTRIESTPIFVDGEPESATDRGEEVRREFS